MGRENERVRCGHRHGQRKQRRIGANRNGQVDGNGHEQNGRAHVGHHQREHGGQHRNHGLPTPHRHGAQPVQYVPRDVVGSTRVVHRQPERQEAGQQKHRFPAHRTVSVIHAQHPGNNHAHGTGHERDGQGDGGEDHKRQGQHQERYRKHHLVGMALLARVVGGDHHKVTVFLQLRQMLPPGVADQRVASADRAVGQIIRDRLAVSHHRQQAQAVGHAQPKVPRGAADQRGFRRYDNLRHAGDGTRQKVPQLLELRAERQPAFLDEVPQVVALRDHRQRRGRGDGRVQRRRHQQLVGVPGSDDANVETRLHLIDILAHKGALGGHFHLTHRRVDTMNTAQVAHRARAARHGCLGLSPQQVATRNKEVDQATQHQHSAKRCHIEEFKRAQCLPFRQVLCRAHQQVVEHDERARSDHGERAAEDGAEPHRHHEARHRQPGLRRDAGNYRQEQRCRAHVLHER